MMRLWLTLALLLAVVGSAMALVVLKHESRKSFTQLQVANEARDDALTEWSRLQLELASLAELGRIERTAKSQLRMQSPAKTEVVIAQPVTTRPGEVR